MVQSRAFSWVNWVKTCDSGDGIPSWYPYLEFSIVMTCLLFDANKRINQRFGVLRASISLVRSLLDAGDTLIIEAFAGNVQVFMEDIQREGKKYGLEFNHAKLEAI